MRNRLQEIRQHQNLTPTELARKAGVSLKTVLAAEKGRLPRESTRRCLANALHVNVRHIWPSSRTEKKRVHTKSVKHCIPAVSCHVTAHRAHIHHLTKWQIDIGGYIRVSEKGLRSWIESGLTQVK